MLKEISQALHEPNNESIDLSSLQRSRERVEEFQKLLKKHECNQQVMKRKLVANQASEFFFIHPKTNSCFPLGHVEHRKLSGLDVFALFQTLLQTLYKVAHEIGIKLDIVFITFDGESVNRAFVKKYGKYIHLMDHAALTFRFNCIEK